MAAGVVGVGRWLVVSLPHRWCGLTVGGFGLFVLRMGWLVVVWLVLVLRWVSLCLWLGTRGLGCWLPVVAATWAIVWVEMKRRQEAELRRICEEVEG